VPTLPKTLTAGWLACTLISGCCVANTTLLPQGQQATIISTSSDSNCCVSEARDEAAEHCEAQGKALNVLTLKTEYQGVDKRAKAAVGIFGALTGTDANLNTTEDYRTELKFQCDEVGADTAIGSEEINSSSAGK
jgi:hypothetical protein